MTGRPAPADVRPTVWDRLAGLIARRPGLTLALGLAPVVLLLAGLPLLRTSLDVLSTLPPSAESVRGYRALEQHLPAGETTPLLLVVDTDGSVFEPAALRALGEMSSDIRRVPGVASVRSLAMPTGGRPPADDGQVAAGLAELDDGLSAAAAGAQAVAGGVEQVDGALAEIERRLPELVTGLAAGRDGAAALLAGSGQAREGLGALRGGMGALEGGLAEAATATGRLRREVAQPTAEALERAVTALDEFTLGRLDPRFRDAAEAVGQAYGRVTGRYPPGHPEAGQRVDPRYDGLDAALAELAGGLDAARDGAGQLDAGLAALDGGLAELAAGLEALRDGLAEGHAGAEQLLAGIAELRARVAGELVPGARELAAGLAEADAQVDAAEVGALLGDDGGPFVVTPAMLEARPQLREELGRFTATDERRTRVFVGLASDPFSDEAITTTRAVEATARRALVGTPLEDATVLATGSSAFFGEVDRAAARDFPIIVAAVLAGVFLVLTVLLRSVVVPLYMVATVLLTYGAALGASALVFQVVLGEPGIQWWLPPMLFVLLVVLGVDYSIFLMSRVREESARLDTREAVAEGVRRTGRVITSCGIILAGTFAALLFAPLRSLVQLGFAATVGILLDTFVVRAVLVPSLATLLGRRNWWPSRRSRAA